jgi:hypothetical protein
LNAPVKAKLNFSDGVWKTIDRKIGPYRPGGRNELIKRGNHVRLYPE